MSQKPHGATETSTLVQALVTGLWSAQVPVVNRMTAIGVPKNLIDAAVVLAITTEEAVRRLSEIITWVVETHKISPAAALRVLNGETKLLDEQMASQAPELHVCCDWHPETPPNKAALFYLSSV